MFQKGYTYNDILLTPRYSEVMSRREVKLESKLTPKITLKIPLISSNMDTVTEASMAISMAKAGGLGIIHRYCTGDEQCQMVRQVKQATSYLIRNPSTCSENTSVKETERMMNERKVGCLLVVRPRTDQRADEFELMGIVTRRDLLRASICNNAGTENTDGDVKVPQIMTARTVNVEWSDDFDYDAAYRICIESRLEQLPVLKGGSLYGLVTLKDLAAKLRCDTSPSSRLLDRDGRLMVGAAIGVHDSDLDRAAAIVDAGCDLICVDVAHGHHQLCGNMIRRLRLKFGDMIEIMAGNVVTPEGVQYLADAGADTIRVGVGGAAVCTTRGQTGNGLPQFSAVLECSERARALGVTVISDGGHCGQVGNLVKALAAGASACMLGKMLAGTTESPGLPVIRDGQKVKVVRGMAGLMANLSRSERNRDTRDHTDMTPEGVEGYVPFKGEVAGVLTQLCGGIRSGLSYQGCHTITELHRLLASELLRFTVMTSSGREESGNHGIKPF